MNRFLLPLGILSLLVSTLAGEAVSADANAEAKIREAMKRAGQFFFEKAAKSGGYVYYYSPDFSKRLGEGPAGETEIWVQPPGTPTVGLAFLAAYEATNDPYFLQAAKAAGEALIYGQLQSGGWRNLVEMTPGGPRGDRYRNGKGNSKGNDNSTLDDGISQGALRFLVRLDRALNFENSPVHEAVEYGMNALLKAQFPNGAFPQVWQGPVESRPVVPTKYPDYDWRTEGRIKEYWDHYTLNDGLAGTVTELLIDAAEIYPDKNYGEVLQKLGDFLILAQMPDPQPAWAQQYDAEMHPIWARKFEPPAIAGRESEDVMVSLLKISRFTGDMKYLEPIVEGVKYLESSLLPDDRLARYYELKTNKPLYMSRKGGVYSLTNDDSNLPSHYGWQNETRLAEIKEGYRAVSSGNSLEGIVEPGVPTRETAAEIVNSLDSEGRWISRYAGEPLTGQPKFKEGEEYISSEVFSGNMETLSRYLISLR